MSRLTVLSSLFVASSSTVLVSIEGHDFRCLVDTGAAITAVNAHV